MTVGELREILKSYPAGMLVMRGDDSGGYENIYQPQQEKVTNMLSPGWQIQAVTIE